jgi:hypothetical protein
MAAQAALSYADFRLFSPVGIALSGCLLIIFVSENAVLVINQSLLAISHRCGMEPAAVAKSRTMKPISYDANIFRL